MHFGIYKYNKHITKVNSPSHHWKYSLINDNWVQLRNKYTFQKFYNIFCISGKPTSYLTITQKKKLTYLEVINNL
jgi:hypothetical protein